MKVLSIDNKILVANGSFIAGPNLDLQDKTIVPGADNQTIVADEGYYGLNNVTVEGDENLISENIAEGKDIFGVVGSFKGGEDVSTELTEQDELIEQISLALEGKAAVGGTEKPFAIIGVTYPEGSTCTCSKDETILTLKDTNGQDFFFVPESGIWTVIATQGTNTKSKDVEITTEGQLESIELAYRTVLFSTSSYSGWTKKLYDSEGSVTFNADGITLTGSTPSGGSNDAYWVMGYKKVTRSSYSTLGFNITSLTKGSGVKIWASNSLPDFNSWFSEMSFGASTSIAKTGEATVSISTLADTIYVGIIGCGNSSVIATDVWLE